MLELSGYTTAHHISNHLSKMLEGITLLGKAMFLPVLTFETYGALDLRDLSRPYKQDIAGLT